MQYRCANDKFGYCAGKEKTVKDLTTLYYPDGNKAYKVGGKCLRAPATCGLYQTNLELQRELDLAHGYKPLVASR